MGHHWVSSAVRITSATANVAEISKVLGMEPTRAHERGTLTSPRNPESQRRDRLVWLVDSDVPEESSLEDHLRWAVHLAGQIRARGAALPEDWSGDIHIAWTPEESQEGVHLDRELLAALGETSFNLLLSVYANGDE
jgi:Domain of unknown function (DUF4279)